MKDNSLAKKGPFNFVLFLVLAFLWSGSFINIKVVVDTFPPVFCAMVRVFISLVSLSILFIVMRKKVFLPPRNAVAMWVAGLFAQALPFAFLFYGEKFIAPGLASIINSTVTIWALILGTIFFRDLSQWTPIKVAGIAMGFLGIVLIFAPFLHGSENSQIGILSVTGMAVAYAIGGLINQHVIFKNKQVVFENNLIQQHIASVVFLAVTSLTLESWPSWSSMLNYETLLAFLYLGVMATAIAWMIYFYLIREWGAVRAVSVMYLVPVLAVVWDAVFLHLIPGSNEVLGMLAILIGVTLIQLKRKARKISVCPPDLSVKSEV